MILISKGEAVLIREAIPDLKIVRTCVQKSKRHRYYLSEVYDALKLIANTNVSAAKIIASNSRRKNYY